MTRWEREIRTEALKLIRRFENYARSLAEEERRRRRRTLAPAASLRPLRPAYWSLAPGFDPYIARGHACRIAHSIQGAVSGRRYAPRNAVVYPVPKHGGGTRHISVFQVADAAVSRAIFSNLLKKNRPRMSSRAYAYRDDISVHDALQHLSSELRGSSRVFVAEYDFSKFFDNISHDYIWKVINDYGFLVTPVESAVLKAVLAAPAHPSATYVEYGGSPRTIGVPQGTSVSLFLANLAAWELDRAIERLGVSFVRYADDTVIWSNDYSQICRATETLHDMSERIGAPLNFDKSAGIRLLTPPSAPAEMARTDHIDFLGHRISASTVSIKPALVDKIKLRIRRLLYFNLLQAPLQGMQDPARLGGVDRDYTTFIWQLRRFLYGDISERNLRRMRCRGVARRRFKGLMSFFPLVDDDLLLDGLDRWLICQTCMALRKRGHLLAALGLGPLPPPHGVQCSGLPNLIGTSATSGAAVDLRLPSFVRIGSVIRRAVSQHGPSAVAQGLPYEYS